MLPSVGIGLNSSVVPSSWSPIDVIFPTFCRYICYRLTSQLIFALLDIFMLFPFGDCKQNICRLRDNIITASLPIEKLYGVGVSLLCDSVTQKFSLLPFEAKHFHFPMKSCTKKPRFMFLIDSIKMPRSLPQPMSDPTVCKSRLAELVRYFRFAPTDIISVSA